MSLNNVMINNFEPNDSMEFAISYTEIDNLLNTCEGDDFFFVDMEVNQRVEIRARFDHMLGDLDMRLYDSNMNARANSFGISNTEEIIYNAETESRYFIHIYGFQDGYNEYTLSVELY